MNKILEISLLIVAVIAVGVADVLIKKIAFHTAGFSSALKNPLMIAVVALYCVQILVFTYVFVKKAELGIVGIIQTALYAVIVIGSGVLFFKEKITAIESIGIILAVAGAILMKV